MPVPSKICVRQEVPGAATRDNLGERSLEVGGWRSEVGRWRLDVGGWGLEVGCWRLEVESSPISVGLVFSNAFLIVGKSICSPIAIDSL